MTLRIARLVAFLAILVVPTLAVAQTFAISETNANARTHFDQGRAALLDVEMEAARTHFDAAIEADPNFALAYVYRAFAAPPAQRVDRMRVASEHAAHATADERALMTALQGLLDDPDGGMEGVNVALARFPDDAHIQYMGGVLNFQTDNYDAAEAALERAIAAEPTMGGAHNILGYVRLEQEDYPGAEAALREYIRLNPTHANPYDSLGEFYLRTGRLDEAETQLEAALERDPAFAASLNNLAWVHIERASQAYEQAVARGDAAAIAALHTPGTVVMPPGMDAVRGRDAVASMWRRTFESGGASLALETDEVVASGNIAYEVGRSTYTPTGGPDFPGKFMAVWVRQDGVWLLHRDIWNENSAMHE